MKKYRVLTINPGSTSTKIALFDGEEQLFEKTLRHQSEELARFESIMEQFSFRKDIIIEALRAAGVDIKSIDAVIGRGGLVKPIPSGVYEVNDALKRDLKNSPVGDHASNLGGLIADDIARVIGVRAFIADPVVVDELSDVARVTGHPLVPKVSVFHALNQKAIARAYAKRQGRTYEDMRLIVAHLGGGISVGAHMGGKVVDVNNALDGDGPFSPERAGTLPAGELVKLCFTGKYTQKEIQKMLCGAGGVVAHLGINDMRIVRDHVVKGDPKTILIQDAMCYNIGKYIGAMAAVLEGRVDAIIITGGIAYSETTCAAIEKMVGFIAPVVVIPGENELEALNMNAQMVLSGEVEPQVYG